MAEDPANDVENSETTEVDSSVDTENAQDSGSEESTTEEQKTEASVPYERFKETNENYKQYKARVEELEKQIAENKQTHTSPQTQDQNPQAELIKKQLTELGFVTREEQQAELKRQQEDARVQQELSRLETKYDGKDGTPKFSRKNVIDYALKNQIGNIELAYKALHEKELIDWQIKKAVSGSSGIKSESSDGSGVSNIGTSNDDLKSQISQGGEAGKQALHTFLKRQMSK